MNKQIYIVTIIFSYILISCSTNKELIKKKKTEYGMSKYYLENNLKNSNYKERLLVVIDNSLYYSFYSDKIIKKTKKDKQLIYTLFFDEIQDNIKENEHYLKLNKMDSLVFNESYKILETLNLKNCKGAKAFIIEVNNYHGYPK